MTYRIEDWAGNLIASGFTSWDLAEWHISGLHADYDAWRGEYFILREGA